MPQTHYNISQSNIRNNIKIHMRTIKIKLRHFLENYSLKKFFFPVSLHESLKLHLRNRFTFIPFLFLFNSTFNSAFFIVIIHGSLILLINFPFITFTDQWMNKNEWMNIKGQFKIIFFCFIIPDLPHLIPLMCKVSILKKKYWILQPVQHESQTNWMCKK